MEAKDTVMSNEDIVATVHRCMLHVEFLREVVFLAVKYGVLAELLEAQAEISFKAGIREVVELMTPIFAGNTNMVVTRFIDEDKLQAQLKEWGIE